jgi:hypothetical protein
MLAAWAGPPGGFSVFEKNVSSFTSRVLGPMLMLNNVLPGRAWLDLRPSGMGMRV